MINKETREQIIALVHREVVPAIGCTEPMAVALCTARASELLGCRPEHITARLSANILKNAMGVGIPGTGMIGLPIAIALGALIGRSEYQLEVLKDLTPESLEEGKQFIAENRIDIGLKENICEKLYIEITATAGDREQTAIIAGGHTTFIDHSSLNIDHSSLIIDHSSLTIDHSSMAKAQSSMVNDQCSMFKAYIDPIAGTTKRTGDAEADRRGAEFLRNDPKENAEHVMLVDLARNDLSRNCHDVKVEYYKDIQYYSHVIHLVSRVSGLLDQGADPIKAFIDTFPAGTLSGAPKVRAMQLISEYEPHNRGAYGGCIGIIGLDGSLNQAITIRTFVARGGELWFQAGGGIVAKSNEDYELQEVNNKLGALRRAITIASEL